MEISMDFPMGVKKKVDCAVHVDITLKDD